MNILKSYRLQNQYLDVPEIHSSAYTLYTFEQCKLTFLFTQN